MPSVRKKNVRLEEEFCCPFCQVPTRRLDIDSAYRFRLKSVAAQKVVNVLIFIFWGAVARRDLRVGS